MKDRERDKYQTECANERQIINEIRCENVKLGDLSNQVI